ncbi:MAG: FG-GAP-like repeat-containing protein, partial [Bacteroidota bacterium]|nr:FG-GAP-like repeat-containing protein [Bacteroidota bacterium]
GSKIKLYKGSQIFYREVDPSRGFQSSMDYKQVIGIGANKSIDSMVITWPDRTCTRYDLPQLNKAYTIQQPSGSVACYTSSATTSTLFQPLANNFEKHTEDEYVDFYYERNLPEMLSTQGPHIAKGDVNGDGLEDVYIGGAKNQAGMLYLQSSDGKFEKKEEQIFKQYQDFEDVAVLFFDADGDGDLDLFIGAGGNNVQPGAREIQHRLYINDGHGNFSINTQSFPVNNMNIAVAIAYDYDGDGDEDLFVGSRSTPLAYGVLPQSYIYENNGKGVFTDVTNSVNPAISHIGMVTGAIWADVTGDAKKELIITGEWMTTKIFSYNNHKFEELKNTGFENLSGWWQTIVAADINGDGKEDLIIGNVGENFYLHPDADRPVKLWVTDFDGNGSADPFLTQTVKGKDMPVFLKRDVTEQFPALKKDNLKNADYAAKSIQQLFMEDVIAKAQQLQFNYCSSIVALNNGNGTFTVKPLPARVQLSSLNAVCATDINGDGKPDLILGGNLFTFPPQFARLDASYGDVLINNGKGDFTPINSMSTGLNFKAEVKDIKEISIQGKRNFLIAQNDSYPLLYRLK